VDPNGSARRAVFGCPWGARARPVCCPEVRSSFGNELAHRPRATGTMSRLSTHQLIWADLPARPRTAAAELRVSFRSGQVHFELVPERVQYETQRHGQDLSAPATGRARASALCVPSLSKPTRGAERTSALGETRADSRRGAWPSRRRIRKHTMRCPRRPVSLASRNVPRQRARFLRGGAGPCSPAASQRTIQPALPGHGGVLRGGARPCSLAASQRSIPEAPHHRATC
jgi:hypothetical protein